MVNDTPIEEDLRDEYDFATLKERGPRGAYAESYRQGTNLVLLDADVAAVFRSAEAVNAALRDLIDIAKRRVPKAS